MILAIDVGNTNTVLGAIENGVIGDLIRITTLKNVTWAEYAINLKQILDISGIDPRSFEGVVLSSVVPQTNEIIKQAVKRVTGLDCLVIGPGVKTGLNIRIDDPSTLGADLAVGCVAAIRYYGAPCIVIDLGTATTAVLVDENRTFLGGAFFPGVNLSFGALTAGTSLLPAISITAPDKVIATNTVDSMRSGAVYGTAAMLDGLVERMEEEFGRKCTVVATGGLARCIVPYCRREMILDDDLLLKGIWTIWEKNR